MELYIALMTLFTFIIVILLSFILIQFSVLRHTVNEIKDIFRSLRSKIDDLFVYVKHINENINTNNSVDWIENLYRELNEFIYTKNNIKNKKNKSNFNEQDKTAIMTYLKVIYENTNSICKTLDNMNRVPSKPTQTSDSNNKHKKEFTDENFNEPHNDI